MPAQGKAAVAVRVSPELRSFQLPLEELHLCVHAEPTCLDLNFVCVGTGKSWGLVATKVVRSSLTNLVSVCVKLSTSSECTRGRGGMACSAACIRQAPPSPRASH